MANRARNRKTVDAFIKDYKLPANTPGTTSHRIAQFLHDLADEYPGDFVGRRLLAKVAFQLDGVPRENNEFLKKLSNYTKRAEDVLMKEYQQAIISDRVEGYRATTNSDDVHDTKYQRALRRHALTGKTAMKVAEMIDPKNLTGKRKEEFMKTRGALKSIEGHLMTFPQLMAPKKS